VGDGSWHRVDPVDVPAEGRVHSVTGQYAAELTTAVKYGIGVKHVLLDNHSLGKIGKEQLAAGFPVWHTSLHNPDWAAYAELCGATGIKAECRTDGPAMLHVSQDPELLYGVYCCSDRQRR
jgi:pyruvate oxidase